MRKHLPKIVLALLLAALVATLWLGADTLGRIKRRGNLIETRAKELDYYLNSTDIGVEKVTKQFRSGEIRAAIQQRWASGIELRDYPASILAAPRKP